MLTCPTHLPIYFCAQPVDFRKSFDGLITAMIRIYLNDALDQLIAGSTEYESLRADVWKQSPPEAVRTYRSGGFVFCWDRIEVDFLCFSPGGQTHGMPLVVRPRNRRDQRRGLSVAELARSSGFPGKSPEVYATSATNFP